VKHGLLRPLTSLGLHFGEYEPASLAAGFLPHAPLSFWHAPFTSWISLERERKALYRDVGGDKVVLLGLENPASWLLFWIAAGVQDLCPPGSF
jgi:hypothetical protein